MSADFTDRKLELYETAAFGRNLSDNGVALEMVWVCRVYRDHAPSMATKHREITLVGESAEDVLNQVSLWMANGCPQPETSA